MTIHIEQLTFDVIIGLLDFERVTPQQIIIDVTLEYEYEAQNFINYAEVVTLITTHLNEEKYLLLEDALLGTKTLIFTHAPQTKKLWIKITKPNILPLCQVALSHTWNF